MRSLKELIGADPGLAAVKTTIARLLERDWDARRLPPVLVRGETGTGKGLVARAIHRAGPRVGGPFIELNCSAIPEPLLEAELFGYERGAFTDARQAKPGLFQAANRGTIFLDEIGLLPEALQAKLLKVLEDREVRRLGSTRSEAVDVWILTATSEDLEAAIRTRRFREDLYHRLAVVTLWLPPLRERGRDPILLAEHFLARVCKDYGLPPKSLDEGARAALLAYRWPGNIRELGNVLERVALLSEGAVVTAAMLGLPEGSTPRPVDGPAAGDGMPLGDAVDRVERAHLLEALRQTDWNITRAAARLGISRNTLRSRLRKHRLRPQAAPGSPAPTAKSRPEVPASHAALAGAEGPAAPGSDAGPRAEAGDADGAGVAAAEPAPTAPSTPDRAPQAAGSQSAAISQSPPNGASPAALRWERRRLTLLRAALAAPADSPPDAQRVLESLVDKVHVRRVLEVLVEKVHTFGGRLEELSSAGIVAAFGLEPGEDAPRRAAHAAMAILRAAELARRGGADPLAVRIGIHVCHAMVGRVDGQVEIDLDAKREAWGVLEAEVGGTEPNTIRVSDAAAPFLERRFELTPTGALEGARGRTFRLSGREGTGLGLGGRLATFVGRQAEMGLLERLSREACNGTVQAVDVLGDAGIGKSRLVHELRQRLEGARVVFLQGHCTAFDGSTPFLPFIEVVRSAFLLTEADGPTETTRKLRRGLHLLGLPATDALPVLQVLLGLDVEGDLLRGLDGEIVGARTREVIHAILRERCRLSPVVLVIDDLHWADTASQGLLVRLLEGGEPMPLLVICTYRPPYRTPWAGRRRVAELRLGPLSAESCLHLARHRLGAETLPEPLARLIVAKAEGNPLFAEELTRYLLDTGSVRCTDGELSFPPGAGTPPVPATLHDLLMARVDRLPDGPRDLLEVAAVIGRRFSPELLRAVSGAGAPAVLHLSTLEDQELVLRQETEGGEEYLFKQVLVQEAIYANLPPGRREALHRAVAEAIERLYESRAGEWAEVLAHHYSRTPLIEKAVRYLALAGEKGLRVYSLEEANRRFQQVVDLLASVQGCADEAFLADAVLGWLQVYYYRSDFTGLVALADRYRDRFEALSDPRRLSLLLFWLGFSHFLGARCDLAKPLLTRALELGEAAGDEESVGYASMGLMYAYWVAPGDQPRDAVSRLGERVLDIAERIGNVYLASQSVLCLALHELTSGRYKEARELGARLVELGRGASAPRSIAIGLHALAFVNIYDERYQEAIENAEEAIRIAPDPADRLMARAAWGAALALTGRVDEGLSTLQTVRAELAGGGYLVLLLGVDFPYGAAMVLDGRIAEGIEWIEASIRRFTAWGNRSVPAFGQMILGEIYSRMAMPAPGVPLLRLGLRNLGFALRTRPLARRRARVHLEEAVRIARAEGMPMVLARSLLGLGLLCHAQGRRAEAARHLEEARRIAEPLGSHALLERIGVALEATRPGPDRAA